MYSCFLLIFKSYLFSLLLFDKHEKSVHFCCSSLCDSLPCFTFETCTDFFFLNCLWKYFFPCSSQRKACWLHSEPHKVIPVYHYYVVANASFMSYPLPSLCCLKAVLHGSAVFRGFRKPLKRFTSYACELANSYELVPKQYVV